MDWLPVFIGVKVPSAAVFAGVWTSVIAADCDEWMSRCVAETCFVRLRAVWFGNKRCEEERWQGIWFNDLTSDTFFVLSTVLNIGKERIDKSISYAGTVCQQNCINWTTGRILTATENVFCLSARVPSDSFLCMIEIFCWLVLLLLKLLRANVLRLND